MSDIYVGDTVKVTPKDGKPYEAVISLHPLAGLSLLNRYGFPIAIRRDTEMELVSEGVYHGIGNTVKEQL